MVSKHVIRLLTTACVGLPLLPPAAKAELIAVGSISSVFSIDEATGQGTRIGYTGQYAVPNGLALDAAGILYFVGWSLGSEQDHLVTLDLNTSTLRGGPILSMNVVALAFSPRGTLFGIIGGGVDASELHSIDPNTGATTLIGSMGFRGITTMDFSPTGTLYGWDIGDSSGNGGLGLVSIDTVSGVATDVDPAVNAPDGLPTLVQALAFAPDGTLYAAHNSLLTVDVNTGALTLVGSGGYGNVLGMVWIPEPSALTILLTMAPIAVLAYLQRRKRKGAA